MLRFGGGLHELQELFQRLSLGGVKIETHSYAECRIALDHNAVEDETLDPNFSTRHPKADLHIGSAFHRSDCFDVAAPHAGIGEISPDGSLRAVDLKFHRDKTADAREAAAILPP